MSPNQPQRIALITGSNRGIGFETAQQLAKRGFHVVIAARDEANGQKTAKTIQASDGKATFLPLDVSSSSSIRSAASHFAKISDHLDVLINNAGIYPDKGFNILTIRREQMVQTLQKNPM